MKLTFSLNFLYTLFPNAWKVQESLFDTIKSILYHWSNQADRKTNRGGTIEVALDLDQIHSD